MSAISKYLISVIVCALICSIITGLIGKKSPHYALVCLLCGIFLSLTVVKPLVQVKLEDIRIYGQSITLDAQNAVAYGETIAQTQKNDIIKQRLETYILDKAASLGAELSVNVTLDEDNAGIPKMVSLSGDIAPLARERLTRIIAEELGIAKEDQLWTGQHP